MLSHLNFLVLSYFILTDLLILSYLIFPYLILSSLISYLMASYLSYCTLSSVLSYPILSYITLSHRIFPYLQVQELRRQGIETYSIAIGMNPNVGELNDIATDPDATHVFRIVDESEVDRALDSLLEELCV